MVSEEARLAERLAHVLGRPARLGAYRVPHWPAYLADAAPETVETMQCRVQELAISLEIAR